MENTTSTANGEEFLTVQEIADKFKMAPSWFYARTRRNAIPCIRLGKYLRFTVEGVLQYLEKQNHRQAER